MNPFQRKRRSRAPEKVWKNPIEIAASLPCFVQSIQQNLVAELPNVLNKTVQCAVKKAVDSCFKK